jgi:hypothetical protein
VKAPAVQASTVGWKGTKTYRQVFDMMDGERILRLVKALEVEDDQKGTTATRQQASSMILSTYKKA